MKAGLFDRLDDYRCIKTSEEVKDELEALGYDVVFPASDELQIDIDTEEQFKTFKEQFEMLQNHSDCAYTHTVTESSSGLPHRHIVVRHLRVKDYFENQYQRIAYQASLGSDVRREMLNLLAYDLYEDETPVLFIKKKEEK